MPRGKAGPKPETKEEIEERKNDPTAEEIVGVENVVDVGSPTIAEMSGMLDGDEEIFEERPAGYKCSLPGCPFTTTFLAEMEEHVNGTGHGGFKQADPVVPEAIQPELFAGAKIVVKSLKVPLAEDFLIEQRKELADKYQRILNLEAEKKETVSGFNAKISNIDERMKEIARVLATPHTYENIKCEWRPIDGQNARGLYRLDTGEQVDLQPLSQEERAQELEQANAANADPEVPAEEPAIEPEVEPAVEPTVETEEAPA